MTASAREVGVHYTVPRVRLYAGEGPFRSPVLGAHLVVVEGGRKLRIADDAEGA